MDISHIDMEKIHVYLITGMIITGVATLFAPVLPFLMSAEPQWMGRIKRLGFYLLWGCALLIAISLPFAMILALLGAAEILHAFY